jgi:hypothetical protein
MKILLIPKDGKSKIYLEVKVVPPSPAGAEVEISKKVSENLNMANVFSPYKITILE